MTANSSAVSVLLARFDGLEWAHGPVEAWQGDLPPTDLPITSACVLATVGNRLLLVDVLERGWDLPGGHLDPGEDAEAALLRELQEEAGLVPEDVTRPVPIGWFRLSGSLMLVFAAHLAERFAAPGARLPATGVPHEIRDVQLFGPDTLPAVSADRIWLPFLALVTGTAGPGSTPARS
jgi:8-oxo-dGTP pyrophosphatase MutT (NUDIX family)